MECPLGLEVTWEVYPRFLEKVETGPSLGREIDQRITLFSGLRGGPHTLTLTWNGDTRTGIRALVVHRPPLAE